MRKYSVIISIVIVLVTVVTLLYLILLRENIIQYDPLNLQQKESNENSDGSDAIKEDRERIAQQYPELEESDLDQAVVNDRRSEKGTLYSLTSPLKNSTTSCPIQIEGSISGSWFFEASFPVEIKNSKGDVITSGSVQTAEDWMTSEMVPFNGKISCESGCNGEGELVLKRANASGLPEFDDQIIVPIKFSEGCR